MSIDQRTINLGRERELEEQLDKLARQIHNEHKGLTDAFQPKTVDLSYIKDINVDDVRVFSKEIIKHKAQYDKVLAELKALRRELGREED